MIDDWCKIWSLSLLCNQNVSLLTKNQGNGIIWDQCFPSVEENPVVPQAFGIEIGEFLGSKTPDRCPSFWDQNWKFLGSPYKVSPFRDCVNILLVSHFKDHNNSVVLMSWGSSELYEESGLHQSQTVVSHIRWLILTTVGELRYTPCKTRMGTTTRLGYRQGIRRGRMTCILLLPG